MVGKAVRPPRRCRRCPTPLRACRRPAPSPPRFRESAAVRPAARCRAGSRRRRSASPARRGRRRSSPAGGEQRRVDPRGRRTVGDEQRLRRRFALGVLGDAQIPSDFQHRVGVEAQDLLLRLRHLLSRQASMVAESGGDLVLAAPIFGISPFSRSYSGGPGLRRRRGRQDPRPRPRTGPARRRARRRRRRRARRQARR